MRDRERDRERQRETERDREIQTETKCYRHKRMNTADGHTDAERVKTRGAIQRRK